VGGARNWIHLPFLTRITLQIRQFFCEICQNTRVSLRSRFGLDFVHRRTAVLGIQCRPNVARVAHAALTSA
jgi:hypothetical protein